MENKNTLEDFLFTLEICRKELPSDAHPAHYDRLREIESILKRVVAKSDQLTINEDDSSIVIDEETGNMWGYRNGRMILIKL
jgi:hypothetical protein